MKIERSSGVLLHITSLPGKYGIGDLGPSAYEFLEFLRASGHSYWQLLPLNPTDSIYNHSPYSTHSAFAGNSLLISPNILERDGYIDLEDFDERWDMASSKVNFQRVEEFKERVLDAAWNTFRKKSESSEFTRFKKFHRHWLNDYCLYQALRKTHSNSNWTDWPTELRDRDPGALEAAHHDHQTLIGKEMFVQFLFFSQWTRLLKAAKQLNIRFFGDVPFYINHDSVDCWKNPSIFKLDANKQPTHVSGVPPDLFSETGQLWGTPVYDWKELKKTGYDWWISRLKQNLLLFDVVRLDHFRAFSAYWEVPVEEDTAIQGQWIQTPGEDFFNVLKKKVPDMPFIAEDLGSLDQAVYNLLEKFDFPRMKVLQFAFGDDVRNNPYLPFNHLPRDIVYTGTHDNNTSVGWIRKAKKTVRNHLKKYVGHNFRLNDVHRILHRMALQSNAGLAIIPMQDLLGLGEEAIMNVPGSTEGNWTWRINRESFPDQDQANKWRELNTIYGRFFPGAPLIDKSISRL